MISMGWRQAARIAWIGRACRKLMLAERHEPVRAFFQTKSTIETPYLDSLTPPAIIVKACPCGRRYCETSQE
jgi:hypothetical protein